MAPPDPDLISSAIRWLRSDPDLSAPSHPTDLVMNVDLVRFGIVPLRITSIERLGSDIILKFRTSLGQQYYVEYSPDLSPGSWAAIGSMLIGNGQEYIVADVSAGLSPNQRFYRVNQLP